MKNSKQKGSSFELKIAKKISYWITGDTKNYVVWRSHGSGAVQTITKKITPLKGDIMVVNPIADSFSKICIECKHYKKIDIISLLNNKINIKNFVLTAWWTKLIELCTETKSIPWLIIKQNYNDILLCTNPMDIVKQLEPNVIVKFYSPCSNIINNHEIIIVNFDMFLNKIKYVNYIEEVVK